MFLSPIFFASIGLKVELPNMTMAIILFSITLTIVAIITKIIGCGLGAKLCRYVEKKAFKLELEWYPEVRLR